MEPLTVDQLLDQDRRKQARIEKIKGSTWGSHTEVAIEEARRLFDAELERRRGADNKAGIYLAANPTYPDIIPRDGQTIVVWGVVSGCVKLFPT